MPDSTQAARQDTLSAIQQARADSVARLNRAMLGFGDALSGIAIHDSLPARTPELDATALLSALPASFLYDFGAYGWPDGWSPYGLSPNRIAVTLGPVPFDDPVTGRPRFDLLPVAFLEPLRVEPDHLGAPLGVNATLRTYDAPRPLTTLRYWTGDDGLQSVMATHTQQRRRRLFGQRGVVGLLFGYGGHAADNEYNVAGDGSRLGRMRQVLTRVRYRQPGWSLDVMNLHNRRRLDAHGGVLPRGVFETIYLRTQPDLRNPRAQRRTIRNDLATTLRLRLLPAQAPFAATGYWTAQTFRYRNPGADTLEAKTNRFGVRVLQSMHLGPHRLRLKIEAYADNVHQSNALPGDVTQKHLHASVLDSLRLGGINLMMEGSYNTGDDTFFSGAAGLSGRIGPLTWFAEGWYTGQPVSLIEEQGFGRFLAPAAEGGAERTTQARSGLGVRFGPFDATFFGFAQRTSDPRQWYTTAQIDSIEARVATSRFERVGMGADLGLRRNATRGFYATAQPSYFLFQNPNASPLHRRVAESLPQVFGQGQLGARYPLFTADLLLDVAVRGRFWSQFRSRTLHPQTGLLVIPETGARIFGPSGTLDVLVQGGIRTATLFVVYENILSGTAVLTGNLLVPTYPLPERRLRFGIYWPIFN